MRSSWSGVQSSIPLRIVHIRKPVCAPATTDRLMTTATWSRQSYLGWNSLYISDERFSAAVNRSSLCVSCPIGSLPMRGTFSLLSE